MADQEYRFRVTGGPSLGARTGYFIQTMPKRQTGRVVAGVGCYDKPLVIHASPEGQGAPARTPPRVQLSYSGASVNWKKYYDRLSAFRSMEAEQARGSFPAPIPQAIILARSFLEFLQEANYPPAKVMPSAVGGVGFAFRRRGRKVYVEFNNKSTVLSLFSDGVTEPIVQRVYPHSAGYSSWITTAKAYLDE